MLTLFNTHPEEDRCLPVMRNISGHAVIKPGLPRR